MYFIAVSVITSLLYGSYFKTHWCCSFSWPKPVFSHGQLYVAFSRARALGVVRGKVKDTDQQGKMQAKIVTKNIVCREVLSYSK